jgi:tetratricopeptide (TPR) repeat protein
VLNNLGTSYEIKGNHVNAIESYKQALAISPAFQEAHYNLSATYFNAGKKQEAFQQFEKIIIDTTNAKFKQMLNLIVCQEVIRLSDSITCDPLKNMLKAISNTPLWYKEIYLKANINDVNFKRQLLEDAIYTLDSTEKRVNFVCISTILKKYSTKKITN